VPKTWARAVTSAPPSCRPGQSRLRDWVWPARGARAVKSWRRWCGDQGEEGCLSSQLRHPRYRFSLGTCPVRQAGQAARLVAALLSIAGICAPSMPPGSSSWRRSVGYHVRACMWGCQRNEIQGESSSYDSHVKESPSWCSGVLCCGQLAVLVTSLVFPCDSVPLL
jgi:hypothetical protein